MMDLEPIRHAVESASGTWPGGVPATIEGGCINESFRIGEWFVKVNRRSRLALFEAEELALRVIGETGTIRVPAPLVCGVTDSHAFIVLEYLPLAGASRSSQEELGRSLAALHGVTDARFGWPGDNFIGESLQPNPRCDDWMEFFREHRLAHMLQLAAARGFQFTGTEALLSGLGRFFPEGEPSPSLLHGDLWGGNAGALPDGTPVVFDPAAYYGDREADLAMTTLFGGFSPAFHAAYEECRPRPEGHHLRTTLYNLYHILNHAVLFGGSYPRQAQGMIDSLLRAV
jgi:fructosamine-3-kinase